MTLDLSVFSDLIIAILYFETDVGSVLALRRITLLRISALPSFESICCECDGVGNDDLDVKSLCDSIWYLNSGFGAVYRIVMEYVENVDYFFTLTTMQSQQ